MYITSPNREWLITVQQITSHIKNSSVCTLKYPIENISRDDKVDVALIFGMPQGGFLKLPIDVVAQHYEYVLKATYENVRKNGRLLFGLESIWDIIGRNGFTRQLKLRFAISRRIYEVLNHLEFRNIELLHVFPGLCRPILIAPPKGSSGLKRLILAHHIGHHPFRLCLPILFPFERLFLCDIFIPALLWVAEK
nr:hypothetical protein [Desulfobacterales bacterium]